MFQCVESKECYPLKQVCDGNWNCKDGSDEGAVCGEWIVSLYVQRLSLQQPGALTYTHTRARARARTRTRTRTHTRKLTNDIVMV